MPKAPALLTDLYQLTQAQAYFQNGLVDWDGSFYLHFRANPFGGGYTLACGMAQIAEMIEDFSFTVDDLDYLASLPSASGAALFRPDFLDYLGAMRLGLDIDAVKEGVPVFPYEPIVRISGPLMQAQLMETALLNQVGFQSLVATKAARICDVAKGPVAEFGLRRAQGPAGGIFAARAACVGGCSSTSDVEAGRRFGLPVSGTHAHSWVMAHLDELAAFRAFSLGMPEGCVLLVDTYEVERGIQNAVTVALEMEQRGQRLAGIRIDSGDLAWYSKRARLLLDAAGLDYVKIIVSNDLDEYAIQSLRDQGACIDSWGVGTRLVTAYEEPALSAVYKLSAVRRSKHEAWMPTMKISAQLAKATLPGLLDVRRYHDEEQNIVGDMIYRLDAPPSDDLVIDPLDKLRRKRLPSGRYVQLLEPLARGGKVLWPQLSVAEIQQTAKRNLQCLDASCRRFLNPHSYVVGLEPGLHNQRDQLRSQLHGVDLE
ncbi:MAG: nicotinate phosphoribosyltransferase [Actinomycetia bacterium]|nr:nicotinate phosphoribosyltransferase [Actinomycetes bacterium]